MAEPAWVTRAEAVSLQVVAIRQFGGKVGVRDGGLLDSAMGRARNKWAYENAGLAECAAAYAYGIAMNHPFHDGNKRTAISVAVAFLAFNRLGLTASPEATAETMLAVAMGSMREDALAAWFAANTRPMR